MRTILQMLGLTCRHPYLSKPISGHRSCAKCGEQFEFHNYDVSDDERNTIQHHTVAGEPSIKRVPLRLLRFRKRKEMK